MAPFTPFFTEVLYQNMRKVCDGAEESIHYCSFPQEEGKVLFELFWFMLILFGIFNSLMFYRSMVSWTICSQISSWVVWDDACTFYFLKYKVVILLYINYLAAFLKSYAIAISERGANWRKCVKDDENNWSCPQHSWASQQASQNTSQVCLLANCCIILILRVSTLSLHSCPFVLCNLGRWLLFIKMKTFLVI